MRGSGGDVLPAAAETPRHSRTLSGSRSVRDICRWLRVTPSFYAARMRHAEQQALRAAACGDDAPMLSPGRRDAIAPRFSRSFTIARPRHTRALLAFTDLPRRRIFHSDALLAASCRFRRHAFAAAAFSFSPFSRRLSFVASRSRRGRKMPFIAATLFERRLMDIAFSLMLILRCGARRAGRCAQRVPRGAATFFVSDMLRAMPLLWATRCCAASHDASITLARAAPDYSFRFSPAAADTLAASPAATPYVSLSRHY